MISQLENKCFKNSKAGDPKRWDITTIDFEKLLVFEVNSLNKTFKIYVEVDCSFQNIMFKVKSWNINFS